MPDEQQPVIVDIEGFDQPLTFPPGTTDEEIEAKVAELAAERTAVERGQSPSVVADRDWVDALPSALGLGASIAAGSKKTPTGMGAAGLGGMVGESGRQVIRSIQGRGEAVPETMRGRLESILASGATQAGFEGAGRGVGRAITPVAKTIYGLSMRAPFHVARETGPGLREGMTRIINQGYEDKILPNRWGADRAAQMLKQSADEATRMAAANTTPVRTTRVLQSAARDQGEQMATAARTAGVAPNVAGVDQQLRVMRATNPKRVTPAELLTIRRGAEDVADPVFKAAKAPGGAGYVPPGSQASTARSIAGGAQEQLERILGKPFKEQNLKTQARHGVKSAADYAASRPNMLTNLVAGGTGLATSGGDTSDAVRNAVILRALFSATPQAAVAFGLPSFARYGPRALDTATGGAGNEAVADEIRALLAQIGQPDQ